MANAFVAIADDATAASWNPAGLVQLELAEISIVGSFEHISERFDTDLNPEFNTRNQASNLDLNFASVVLPMRPIIGARNWALSLSYQRKFDFSRSFSAQRLRLSQSGRRTEDNLHFDQEGGLGAISASAAIELTHTISLGVSVHVWRNFIGIENGWDVDASNDRVFTGGGLPDDALLNVRSEEYRNVRGESVSLGLLWNIRPKWNLGFRYDSSLKAKADYERIIDTVNLPAPPARLNETRTVRLPATLSFGVAYRPTDRLTLSADFSTTDWDNFFTDSPSEGRESLLTGQDPDEVDLDRTYTVRLGTEYTFIPTILGDTLDRLWSIRAGVFWDQEPATGARFNDPLDPLDDTFDARPDNFWGATLGLGLLIKQRVNIDLAYQLRYGQDVNRDFLRPIEAFQEDILQQRLLFSTVIYFKRR